MKARCETSLPGDMKARCELQGVHESDEGNEDEPSTGSQI